MKLFIKKQAEEKFKGSSIPRVSNMETQQLKNWFNTTIMHLGEAYDSWRYKDAPDEVSQIITMLDEIWKELQSRSDK